MDKRFTKDFECPDTFISFIYDNEDVLTTGEVVKLLNELHEENQRLKKENKKLKIFKDACDTPNWKAYLKAEGLE